MNDDANASRYSAAMSDAEIVITFQSERNLWYVQQGDATAVISVEDMVNEYFRWQRTSAHFG